jgi:hypothetical protein
MPPYEYRDLAFKPKKKEAYSDCLNGSKRLGNVPEFDSII